MNSELDEQVKAEKLAKIERVLIEQDSKYLELDLQIDTLEAQIDAIRGTINKLKQEQVFITEYYSILKEAIKDMNYVY